MQFEFEGNRYRIVFGYDKDRSWVAHRDHDIAFFSTTSMHRDKLVRKGPPILHCTKCNLHLESPAKKRLARCTLFVHASGAWESVTSGTGRVNLKAGDEFSRKEGREAALVHMLENLPQTVVTNKGFHATAWAGEILGKRFRPAAWAAYLHRKEAGPFRKEATGQPAS